jgi:hypothetical protein
MDKRQAVEWLEAVAKYFEARDTHGEDLAYWSNVLHAENARKIVKILVDSGLDGDIV